MKNLLLSVFLLSYNAFAGFDLVLQKGAIECQGEWFKVILSEDRKELKLFMNDEDGNWDKTALIYEVEADERSYIYYHSNMGILGFDNIGGDTFLYNHDAYDYPLELECKLISEK